jgi:hypothetical protein
MMNDPKAGPPLAQTRRWKRRLLIAGIVLLAALGGTYSYFVGKRYHITMTQQQIDDELEKRFPLTKKHLLIFQATYSNPKVTLLPGTNRVQVGMDAVLNMKIGKEPKALGGTILLTAGFEYRPSTHQFFLTSAELDHLAIEGIPLEYVGLVTKFSAEAVSEHLAKYPVYTLKAKDAKTATVKLLLKDVQVTQKEVIVTLGL